MLTVPQLLPLLPLEPLLPVITPTPVLIRITTRAHHNSLHHHHNELQIDQAMPKCAHGIDHSGRVTGGLPLPGLDRVCWFCGLDSSGKTRHQYGVHVHMFVCESG